MESIVVCMPGRTPGFSSASVTGLGIRDNLAPQAVAGGRTVISPPSSAARGTGPLCLNNPGLFIMFVPNLSW
jgi:hypothetical protein